MQQNFTKFKNYIIGSFLLLTGYSATATSYTVSNTNDAGAGSLRQAITDANTNAGADIINFSISGTITVSSLFPKITETVAINGYTATGALQGAIGSRTITITINGAAIGVADGFLRFTAAAAGSSVSGLSLVNIGTESIQIEPGCNDVHIWGNYIGVNAAGVAGAANVLVNDPVFLGDYTNASPAATNNVAIGTNGDGINDANEGNVIANANTVFGGDGVQIGYFQRGSFSNIRISGNYIGMCADGTTIAPNGSYLVADANPDGFAGVYIKNVDGTNIIIGTDGNGVSDAIESNLISGNAGQGIAIESAHGINIAGNLIGTDKTGLIAKPNAAKVFASGSACSAIDMYSYGGIMTYDVVIGYDDTKHAAAVASYVRNIISGNQSRGINVIGIPVTGQNNTIKIAGNYIGVDKTGNTRLGNGVGATISGFNGNGISVYDATAITIGTDGDNDDDNLEGNVIAGAIFGTGVYISSFQGTMTNSIIAGNKIGVGADGTTAIGNDGTGIFINAATNIRIGSNDDGVNDAAEANIIANNAYGYSGTVSDGVTVVGASTSVRISKNIFYSNNKTPIDLVNDGVSINDGVTTAGQPDILLDYPVFTYSNISGTTMTVSGYVGQCNGTETVAGTVISGTTTVQVYKAADDGDQNAAISANGCSRAVAHGEGVQYLGSITVINGVFTNAAFTLAAGASFAAGDKITGITIDASGNTSEFGVSTTNTTLPITLESFTAKPINCNTTQLSWKISDVINFNHFVIERSFNGDQYHASAKIMYEAMQTSYSLNETNLPAGRYQYRLKMVDDNGEFKYSPVVFVKLDCNQQGIVFVYPNPAKDKITISGLKGNEQVTIYNAQGELVYFKRNTLYQMNIDIQNLANGLYHIIIADKNGEKITALKIAKTE